MAALTKTAIFQQSSQAVVGAFMRLSLSSSGGEGRGEEAVLYSSSSRSLAVSEHGFPTELRRIRSETPYVLSYTSSRDLWHRPWLPQHKGQRIVVEIHPVSE